MPGAFGGTNTPGTVAREMARNVCNETGVGGNPNTFMRVSSAV